MKQLLFFFAFIINTLYLHSQPTDYNKIENWDDICFCSMNNAFHPQTIVNADNNWQLLLAMKSGLTLKELDSLKIPYTRSQWLLLRSQRLIERNQDVYKTSIPILDKEQTVALRQQSHMAAKIVASEIEEECKELVAFLSKNNRSQNVFSILFSYVIDGLIWDRFEKDGIIKEQPSGDGIWSGNYWFLTPKRSFSCGTNSISNGDKYTFILNWSESEKLTNEIPELDDFLISLENEDKITDKKIIDEFSPFGFFDENSNLIIPVIDERENSDLCLISNKITDKLLAAFVKAVDIETVKTLYKFRDNSETVLIFYHEMMWDIIDLLLDKKIIQLPVVFQSPETAKMTDIADLCFITLRHDKTHF
ncbi:MAG: hypothetical protein LBC68_15175 [Prevotellaceae bacterium]|jgi:hypothetical protein|nr:hypothetical protein [Prevotellaceae bacterium]